MGFFGFEEADGAVDVALGLRPDRRGLGADYPSTGLKFAGKRFAPQRSALSGAPVSGRAASVYGRGGFGRGGVVAHETNGGEHEFPRVRWGV